MVDAFFPGRRFAAFLFDFDGTVADTMPTHFTAWNKALGEHGLELTKKQHQTWAGRPTREIVKLLSELHQVDLSPEKIASFKEKHYYGSLSSVREIGVVADVIRANHGKIPMAIVSGSRRKPVTTTLAHLGLTDYFDVLVCAEDYTHGKPAPDPFLKAALLLGVPAADCLVFEDADLGLRSAKAAGMACLLVHERADGGFDLKLS